MSEAETSSANLNDSTGLFDKALETWSMIDLPRLQKELDQYGLEFQDYQKESLVGRKQLATKTKSFKRLTQEEKVGEINPLLKSYQKEIDDLAKKNKNVDNAFFQVYRAIAEAPDPKPLLKMSLDAVNSMSELEKLKNENRQLEETFLGYADYEQLKTKNTQLEEELTKVANLKVQATEDEWKALLEEKEDNWDKRRAEYERTVKELQKQLEDFKVNEEIMKLKLDNKNKALRELDEDYEDENDEEEGPHNEEEKPRSPDGAVQQRAASNMEIQILSRDVESSKLRIMELEKRNEELRREVSTAKSSIDSDTAVLASKKRISELESSNVVLIARLEHERQAVDRRNTEIRTIKESTLKESKRVSGELEALKEYKSKTHDYDEIKKELEVLKQIEFGDNEDEADTETAENGKTVESSIVQRNKKLNNEVIEYRSENEDLVNRCNQLEAELKSSIEQLEESRKLSEKLEKELENVENTSANDKWETMSMISSIAPSGNGKLSPAASIAGGALDSRSVVAPQQDSSILPIITQQRDRFRKKNKELEEESKKQFTRIVDLKRDIQSLKSDNKDLYEKIRYMEYHNAAQNENPSFDEDVEKRYKESYEMQLHPIEKFRRMESKRISSRMSPFERVFIQATKLIMSTKYTRWLFVFYCLGLHLLVLILTIYLVGDSGSAALPDRSVISGSTGGIANGVSEELNQQAERLLSD
ncbi:DEKNAAC104953 [Brettanomyces naardenensis]|uniref:Protein CASP n=1 Tax=Brettanomyces naardenensis TaxID=13370 RepID=A0A448YS80_BRENA|nr:DEKNAAC104953 [Brettanomyces naardenensis]